jgi:hypothetical protein
MAMLTGTQVDPRLMKADLSGFTKASEIQAQGMQAFAKSIGGGIEKFAKKKKEQKQKDSATDIAFNFAKRNPGLAENLGFDVLNDEGFLDDEKMKESSKDFVNTVGVDGLSKSIMGLLELDIKAQSTASDKNTRAIQDAYDPMGYQQKLQFAQTDPNYVMRDDGVYYDPDPNQKVFNKKDQYKLTADDPLAKPFITGKGSGMFFPDAIPTYSGGLNKNQYQYAPESTGESLTDQVNNNDPAGLF